jgi:hypothetical protein
MRIRSRRLLIVLEGFRSQEPEFRIPTRALLPSPGSSSSIEALNRKPES